MTCDRLSKSEALAGNGWNFYNFAPAMLAILASAPISWLTSSEASLPVTDPALKFSSPMLPPCIDSNLFGPDGQIVKTKQHL